MNTKELASVTGKKERTIQRECKAGKIKAEFIKGHGWEIPFTEAQRVILAVTGKISPELHAPPTPLDDEIRYEAFIREAKLSDMDASRFMAIMKYLNKNEADLYLKTEQALGKSTDNLAVSEQLINLKDVETQIGDFIFRMFNQCKSMINLWQTKYNLSPVMSEEMRQDWYKILTDTKKAILEKCSGSSRES